MTRLVGIAKLAAASASLEAKRRVEYRELTTRSFLSKCDSPRVPFRWMINPYRGCEFGCQYCYARYTHEFMELREPEDFERKIFVKHFEERAFRAELLRIPVGESIAIGTATDPYQPAERRFGLTRSILETFAQSSGFRIGLITKSDLIARDIGLFQEIAKRHYLTLVITITTLDRDLARRLEPLAPRPDLRVATVRKLASAGLRVVVNLAPILPLLNDADPSIDAVAKASARAGAAGLNGNVVFLKDCAKKVLFPFLEAQYPQLVRRYHERFDRDAFLRGGYPDMIRERVRRVRKRYGLEGGDQPQPEFWPETAQLSLFT